MFGKGSEGGGDSRATAKAALAKKKAKEAAEKAKAEARAAEEREKADTAWNRYTHKMERKEVMDDETYQMLKAELVQAIRDEDRELVLKINARIRDAQPLSYTVRKQRHEATMAFHANVKKAWVQRPERRLCVTSIQWLTREYEAIVAAEEAEAAATAAAAEEERSKLGIKKKAKQSPPKPRPLTKKERAEREAAKDKTFRIQYRSGPKKGHATYFPQEPYPRKRKNEHTREVLQDALYVKHASRTPFLPIARDGLH